MTSESMLDEEWLVQQLTGVLPTALDGQPRSLCDRVASAEVLWDLLATAAHAAHFSAIGFRSIVALVLAAHRDAGCEAEEARLVECLLGGLANAACHGAADEGATTAGATAADEGVAGEGATAAAATAAGADWVSVTEAVLGFLAEGSDAPSLCEALRFVNVLAQSEHGWFWRAMMPTRGTTTRGGAAAEAATEWPRMGWQTSERILGRLVFILDNSLNGLLVSRALDFLAVFCFAALGAQGQ